MFRRILRPLMYHLYRPLLLHYLRKDRRYRTDGFDMNIRKSVFHPAFFGSTKVFAAFLKKQPLSGLSMLEIGCGSGLLSLTAARMGARVTTCDINNSAVNCTLENAQHNNQVVDVDTSDLFDNVPQQPFDCIIVNPPFYEGQPTDDASYAWYCGPTFDFFHRFFKDLFHYAHTRQPCVDEPCRHVRYGRHPPRCETARLLFGKKLRAQTFYGSLYGLFSWK